MPRARLTAAAWLAAVALFSAWAVTASAQQVFAPGQLETRHERRIDRCSTCHAPLRGVTDEKCMSCHTEISRDRERGRGLHGQLRDACPVCHKLHGKAIGEDLLTPSSLKIPEGTAFDHPPVREHSYRSFECSACHPKDFSSWSCEKCHRGGDDEEEDDD